MPYSKDPTKYPYTFEVFLKGLEGRGDVAIKQRMPDRSEAVRNRVMMQSFLAAVSRRADQLDQRWGQMMREALGAKGNEKAAEARLESYRVDVEKWKTLARTAAGLAVRSGEDQEGWFVSITTRSAGAFGDALVAAVGGKAAIEARAAAVDVRPEMLTLQDQGRDWLATGSCAGAEWLTGAKWTIGQDGENLRELAGAMLSVLGDPIMAGKQADAAFGLLTMKRMQEARSLTSG